MLHLAYVVYIASVRPKDFRKCVYENFMFSEYISSTIIAAAHVEKVGLIQYTVYSTYGICT